MYNLHIGFEKAARIETHPTIADIHTGLGPLQYPRYHGDFAGVYSGAVSHLVKGVLSASEESCVNEWLLQPVTEERNSVMVRIA